MPKNEKNISNKDRRYKDPSIAPDIVSEKRITFFMPNRSYKAIKLLLAYCELANIEQPDLGPFPEKPSAFIREAIDYYLDAIIGDFTKKENEEWKSHIKGLKEVLKKQGIKSAEQLPLGKLKRPKKED